MSPSNQPDPIQEPVPSPRRPLRTAETLIVFAHRGERGHFPENTLLAFEKAARYDINALEVDIHITRDGVPVVIHDETVDRTTNGQGRVCDLTLAELKVLDAGYHWPYDQPPENQPDSAERAYPFRGQGLTIPTVAELFEAHPDLWINIDIKHHSAEIIEPFVRVIREHDMTDRVFVGSFDDRTLDQFRQACPDVTTGASASEVRRLVLLQKIGLSRFAGDLGRALQIPVRYGPIRLVTPGLVEAANRIGVGIHVWTVNDEQEMRELIDMGVDGLITDYPGRLIRLLGRD